MARRSSRQLCARAALKLDRQSRHGRARLLLAAPGTLDRGACATTLGAAAASRARASPKSAAMRRVSISSERPETRIRHRRTLERDLFGARKNDIFRHRRRRRSRARACWRSILMFPARPAAAAQGKIYKLSSNETPLGPSPRAIEAFQRAAGSLRSIPTARLARCAKRSAQASWSRSGADRLRRRLGRTDLSFGLRLSSTRAMKASTRSTASRSIASPFSRPAACPSSPTRRI